MMRSLFTGVSGLKNHQVVMDVIGNNIANVNTIGFKSGRANFQDILSQTIDSGSGASSGRGGVNPMQIGLGTSVSSIDTIFTVGSTQATGKNTDLAINGNGFFMVTDSMATDNVQKKYYTRAGNFDFDSSGNLVMSSQGMKVMGWLAKGGEVDTKGDPKGIKIDMSQTMPGKKTDTVTYTGNLSASDAIGTTAQGALSVYDSEGKLHRLGATFTKVSDSAWLYNVDNNAGDGNLLNPNNMGQITFNSDGSFKGVMGLKPGISALNNSIATSAASFAAALNTDAKYTVLSAATTSASVAFADAEKNAIKNITSAQFGSMQLNASAGSVTSAQIELGGADGQAYKFTIEIKTTTENQWTYKVTPSSDSGTGTITWYGANYVFAPSTFSYGLKNGAEVSANISVKSGGSVAPKKAGSSSITDSTFYNNDPAYKTAKDALTSAVAAQSARANTVIGSLFTDNVSFTNMKLDSKAGNTNYKYFTTYDTTGAPHNFQMTVTPGSGANTWSYAVSELGKASSAITDSQGTITYTAVSGYTISVGDRNFNSGAINNFFTFKTDNGVDNTVNLNLTDWTCMAPADGSFGIGAKNPIAETKELTFDSLQLDSKLSSSNVKKFTIIDGNGVPKELQMTFTCTGGNSWDYTVKSTDSKDTTVYATGATTWNKADEKYVDMPKKLSIGNQSIDLTFPPKGSQPQDGAFSVNEIPVYQTTGTQSSVYYQVSSQQAAMQITYGFSGMTQYGNSTNVANSGNGYAAGSLDKMTIDDKGYIIGSFSNNHTQVLAQMAMSNFKNPSGLDKVGDALYSESANSGTPVVGKVGDNGFGNITPGALEMSNVDLAQEFSNMITTQRGFQANSKIINTADEMLQELANLKR